MHDELMHPIRQAVANSPGPQSSSCSGSPMTARSLSRRALQTSRYQQGWRRPPALLSPWISLTRSGDDGSAELGQSPNRQRFDGRRHKP